MLKVRCTLECLLPYVCCLLWQMAEYGVLGYSVVCHTVVPAREELKTMAAWRENGVVRNIAVGKFQGNKQTAETIETTIFARRAEPWLLAQATGTLWSYLLVSFVVNSRQRTHTVSIGASLGGGDGCRDSLGPASLG